MASGRATWRPGPGPGCGEVQRLTGKAPIVYVGYYFWRDNVGNPTDIGANYRLWLPSYPADPNSTTFRPLVPAGWSTWTFWQYTSTGTVPGISGSVDVNRYCCDAGNLAALGGSGVGAGNPFGNLESAARIPGSVSVQGWAIDPDTTGSVAVHVYVDGAWAGQATANVARPTWARPSRAGTRTTASRCNVPVGPGDHRVCAYAINVGQRVDQPRPRVHDGRGQPARAASTPPRRPPPASSRSRAGPSTPTPPRRSRSTSTSTAPWPAGSRPACRAPTSPRCSRSGTNAGYEAAIPAVPAGSHEVCAYAINVGSGTTNPNLGCRTVTVLGGDPAGSLEQVDPGVGAVRVAGLGARRRHRRRRSTCTSTSTATGRVRPPPTSPAATSAPPSR